MTNLKLTSIVAVLLSSLFLGCIDEATIARPTPVLTPASIPTEVETIRPTITIIPTDASRQAYQQGNEQDFNLSRNSQRKFIWNYGDNEWYLTLNFNEGIYNLYKNRSRSRDYDLFASDPYDDELIRSIADSLKKAGEENGLTDLEIPYLAISFMQSLPYTSDEVTTGFDEFPRFPYETLYDGGGDCEDTSILASAILQEMGYGVVLIEFPGHMAVGVKCSSDIPGYSYDSNGQRYCYLETTGKNWPVGELPDEYKGSKAKIIYVYARPVLDIDFTYNYQYNYKDVYIDVNITVKNLGSEIAKNTKIYVSLQTSDTSRIWSQQESQYIQIPPESVYTYNVKNLYAPTGRDFRIYVRAYGDNVISDEAVGGWITWKTN